MTFWSVQSPMIDETRRISSTLNRQGCKSRSPWRNYRDETCQSSSAGCANSCKDHLIQLKRHSGRKLRAGGPRSSNPDTEIGYLGTTCSADSPARSARMAVVPSVEWLSRDDDVKRKIRLLGQGTFTASVIVPSGSARNDGRSLRRKGFLQLLTSLRC